MSVKGTVVAAMVAGLFAGAAPLVAHSQAKAGKVKCEGGNACKGKSACKSASSGCAGQNGCKGKGWVETKDEAECKKMGGKVAAK